jgi:hypothetical protein
MKKTKKLFEKNKRFIGNTIDRGNSKVESIENKKNLRDKGEKDKGIKKREIKELKDKVEEIKKNKLKKRNYKRDEIKDKDQIKSDDKRLLKLREVEDEFIKPFDKTLFSEVFSNISNFKLSDLLLKGEINHFLVPKLEEVVSEGVPGKDSLSEEPYNQSRSLAYNSFGSNNSVDSNYKPADKNYSSVVGGGEDNSKPSGDYISQNNYEDVKSDERGPGGGFYEPSFKGGEPEVGEIRPNIFKSNLESAATENKKSNKFKPQFY